MAAALSKYRWTSPWFPLNSLTGVRTAAATMIVTGTNSANIGERSAVSMPGERGAVTRESLARRSSTGTRQSSPGIEAAPGFRPGPLRVAGASPVAGTRPSGGDCRPTALDVGLEARHDPHDP